MKTKEISYRRVFSLGDFQTETYGITIEMIESTDVQEAINLARTTIEEAHAKVMSERAKPERVEKVGTSKAMYGSGTNTLTSANRDTILNAIQKGKVTRHYIDTNFCYNEEVKIFLDNEFKQLNK